MGTVKFKKLWSSYPDGRVLGGCKKYEHQCAIRVSQSLNSAGHSLNTSYPTHVCTASKNSHARGAEDLAKYLKKNFKKPDIYTPLIAKGKIKGRTGIVFFKDIKGFRGGIGDHIDLWNGKETKTGEYFKRCKKVWFFEIK